MVRVRACVCTGKTGCIELYTTSQMVGCDMFSHVCVDSRSIEPLHRLLRTKVAGLVK